MELDHREDSAAVYNGRLSPTAISASITLNWSAVTGTTSYEVKRSPGSATPTAADRINSHTFSSLTAGTAYTLYVRATDGGRPSAWSSPVTATTALTAPPAP